MSRSPNRRSVSRASSVSSECSTPVSRRRNVRRASNGSVNPTTTSAYSLRRLQSKPKSIKGSNANNDDPNNTTDIDEPTHIQQQHRTTESDNSSMMIDQSDTNMITPTIIASIYLAQSDDNNNNIVTTNSHSPVISDVGETIDGAHDDTGAGVLNPQATQGVDNNSNILAFFDECENDFYKCKFCPSVRFFCLY
jgi:hypothetical protein